MDREIIIKPILPPSANSIILDMHTKIHSAAMEATRVPDSCMPTPAQTERYILGQISREAEVLAKIIEHQTVVKMLISLEQWSATNEK